MRYLAPTRDAVEPAVFAQRPLRDWAQFEAWMQGEWPSIGQLNQVWPETARERFVAQTRELLEDGLHYETRIAERGLIATREQNWHDLFNAMMWLRYPALKRALNRQQVLDVQRLGHGQRSRAQYAQTHFDEAGVVVRVSDARLIALWDAHDWHGLFWRERAAWLAGAISVQVFGHALLEHALTDRKLLVGKALVVLGGQGDDALALEACARGIETGALLRDPLELRPLPLSGIPGWHVESDEEAFHHSAACYQPRREGRHYPPPLSLYASL